MRTFSIDAATPVKRPGSASFAPRYRVSQPGDRHERAADQAASAALAGPVSPLARRHDPGTTPLDAERLSARIDGARGGGQPLPPPLRSDFEPRFGHDFGAVRVHTDSEADSLGRALGARAFTVGADLFIRPSAYDPSSTSGRGLIAHELAHVAQRPPATTIQRQTDAAYEKSTHTDEAIAAGTMVEDSSVSGKTVTASNCGGVQGCNIDFRFDRAFKGTRNYRGDATMKLKGIHVSVSATNRGNKCGAFPKTDLIQVTREFTGSGAQRASAKPTSDTRAKRAGWDTPTAPSRGWYVDAGETATSPISFSPGWNGQAGDARTPAHFWDGPSDWATTSDRGNEFQTCLFGFPSSGKATPLACLRWGYYINGSGTVSFDPTPPTASCTAPTEVPDAVKRMEAQPGVGSANVDFTKQPTGRP
jgi:Domain of unknown function (DUF4157)